jgi:uncharacterized protein (TIGR02996 family)
MIDWTRDYVASQAPDAAGLGRAEKLADPEGWTDLGSDVDKVWGACPGSKGKSYQVTVYRQSGHSRCSCPSRQHPCKHGLALMLLLVEHPGALGISVAAEAEGVALDEGLARAREAMEARDREAALRALLDTWRGTPAPEIADLIDLLDAAVTEKREAPLTTLKRSALQPAWIKLARAADPTDLGALFATIARGTNDQAVARIEALGSWPPDPRITSRLGEMLVRWEVLKSEKAASFWYAAFRLMLAIEDTRLVGVLEGIGDSHRHKMGIYTYMRMKEELAELRQRLRDRDQRVAERAALTDEARGQIAELHRLIAPGETSASHQDLAQRAEEILAQIYAAPDDDQLRQVYADVLTQLDDPRGELITLQYQRLSAKPKAAAKKREKELLDAHRSDWLGPLVHFVLKKELRFERGFLDAGHYNHERYFDVDSVLDDPRWRTLRVLRSWQPPALTFHPNMVSLREVEIDERGVETLTKLDGTRPFTTVTLIDDGSLADGPLLESAGKLPDLRELTIRGDDKTATEVADLTRLAAFLDHRLSRQLHHLTVRTPLRRTEEWLARLEAFPGLQTATLLSRHWESGNWDLVFSRSSEAARFDRLEATFRNGDYGQGSLPDVLPALESLGEGRLVSIAVTTRAKPEGELGSAFLGQLERIGVKKRKLPKSWQA